MQKADSENATGFDASEGSCLVFYYASHRYAVLDEVVRQLCWLPELDEAEGLPDAILGIFSLADRLVPVMDLNLLFGRDHVIDLQNSKLLVIQYHEHLLALVADQIEDLCSFHTPEDALYSVEADAAKCYREVVAGGRLTMLLNHTRLIEEPTRKPSVTKPAIGPMGTLMRAADSVVRDELRRRAQRLAALPEDDEVDVHGLVTASLSGETLGFPVEQVRELAPLGKITPIPGCPPHIAGNMNLRGDIVTLVDLRSELHLSFEEPAHLSKVVIRELDGKLIGLPVDDIHEVVFIQAKDYRTSPISTPRDSSSFLTTALEHKGKMVTIVDLERFLQRPELIVDKAPA